MLFEANQSNEESRRRKSKKSQRNLILSNCKIMPRKYHCQICKREFLSLSGATQHANAVHQGRRTLSYLKGDIPHRSLLSQ